MDSERPEALEDRVAAELGGAGWAVARAFLEPELVSALAGEARALRERGALRGARIGRGAGRVQRPEIRGDAICWIEPALASPSQRLLLARFESLRLALNRALHLGLFGLEAHFSVYPPRACYQRHSDCFRGASQRVVSCVAYLNQGWQAGDGGALRLHVGRERSVDVAPLGGTLVAFLSERFEHEVLPAARERLSVAAWFRRRAEMVCR
jgi:SM-20-related protein